MTYKELVGIRQKRARRHRFYKLLAGFVLFWVVAVTNGLLKSPQEIALVVTFYVWLLWVLSEGEKV